MKYGVDLEVGGKFKLYVTDLIFCDNWSIITFSEFPVFMLFN